MTTFRQTGQLNTAQGIALIRIIKREITQSKRINRILIKRNRAIQTKRCILNR
ncbi:hypothetical protein KR49_13970 [Synechococcus sp. KORDI-49]|nr:hypothetical protein KR49_13970 [Synechococcus sp. KORDI-49]